MTMTTEGTASVSVNVGDQEIVFETGKLAKQADGAVVVRSGETMVLATAQGRPEAREGADFFPLTVDVEERMYAAGKIPGGFFKREGRPTERAILTARMTDRPIRPLWPKGFKNEVQVICTILSADLVTAHDILCHQRRLGGADDLAAALHGPGWRRTHRPGGRRVRRQPDAARRAGVDPRPRRRRHEGRSDDDRGRRRRAAGGEDDRGVRARARGDPPDLRGAGGAPGQGRQAEVARPVADRGAARGARHTRRRRHHGPRAEGGLGGRRPARGRALSGADDDLDRGRHHEADAGSRQPRAAARRGTPRRRRPARSATSSRQT